MMEGCDILISFYVNICDYFSGKCTAGKCSLVKKHRENLQTDGDFSVPLCEKAQQKHLKICSLNTDGDKICSLNTDGDKICQSNMNDVRYSYSQESKKFCDPQKNLVECSNKWPLKVAQCQVRHDRLCLYLNKCHTFQTILYCILTQGPAYGKLPSNLKKVWLTSDSALEDEWGMNISNYRKNVLICVLKNLLTETGHTVIVDSTEISYSDDFLQYFLASNPPIKSSNSVFIHCGPVFDIQAKSEKKDIVAQDYLRQRCEELKQMSQHKHGQQVEDDENWKSFFRKIGEASLRIDMLSVRPSRCINLNFHPNNRETSRNGHFVLYNCARLAAIQEKFDKMSSENIYPPLVPLEEIDFSLLKKEEEWELLSSYLLMYPQVLRNSIEFLDKGKPMPNLLVQFLNSLCGCYSSYYRRVRVLTESRDHLLPVMFARLYLLKAVECVLHNGLRLLGIEPVRYM